ncbi:putative ABC transport system permease protein [Eubacterium ruminantium]|uniref:Putative ABC transport system permease protein n=1 Tax=Eubacterium ruminantium TaxID=42322 RepID=A0A1T4MZP8_9FIRM|nr:ABC transporter permease [Eubacterium ruminantium]SCW51108.1 putative ABC transport system permease protein [Eubacterium ruminantium]SDM68857.1 putative ABC transport system permease protein [Eubacterium ruminantium]SJZ72108.1 putative ABC transport system permease protein [Eubacterium ruminantium]
MKSPLVRRLPKELKRDFKKYLIIFLILFLTIGFVSGMFVANNSMLEAGQNAFAKYNVEDGHFNLSGIPTQEMITEIEAEGVKLHEQYYKTTVESNDKTKDSDEEISIRVFKIREDVNKVCIMKGRLPEADGEIAIDRMHADNADMKVGDNIYLDGVKYKITGLIAAGDYSALYKNNSDTMFDALTFDIGFVTGEQYEKIEAKEVYQYAWIYNKKLEDDESKKKAGDNFANKLGEIVMASCFDADPLNDIRVEDYVPEYVNQAIHFATNDFAKDEVMAFYLLIILMGVFAFIFAITISNKIEEDSVVIGTLRASGYTRSELISHYMSLPIIVTLAAAALGNIAGYTLFKNVVVSMYYGTYSLPKYVTLWNPKAFLQTTICPVALMLIINYVVIRRKLVLSPLKFLRNDIRRSKRKKAKRLPKWKFINRFRVRNVFSNVSSYLVLFVGTCFVMVLLMFCLGMPDTIDSYMEDAPKKMYAQYQYFLRGNIDEEGNEISTSNPDAEKSCVSTLITKDKPNIGEEIMVVGYSENSKYIKINSELKGNEIIISEPYADKFGIEEGDTITLKEQFTSKEYDFKVKGVYDYMGSLIVFMPIDNYNEYFGNDPSYFSGYISDTEITDIPEKNIYKVISPEDIVKMAKQLDHSMGSAMDYFAVLTVLIAALLIYLITKIIIEKNRQSISMVKVLGYDNNEISKLYIRTTSILMIIFDFLSVFIAYFVINWFWRKMLSEMSGWFTINISFISYIIMIVAIYVAYLIISFIDFNRIKRIPLSEALKNVE